ncbi:MAG: InlB B-repeat-containing protein, partial [Lachnospiraceae bacterium]|nr:InlB B-repeat-containing protein [Lachnospiraceae bacterium]
LGGTSIDNYILSEDGQQTTAVATINKKAVTVTALKQTVAVNGEIENSVEFAELSGALEGHELAEVTLTSSSTAKTTTEGVITPSNAKIVNGDTDVTDNYDITYIDGVMTVTKAEAEVVLDNGDDGAPASVTEVEAPNLQELADEEAEEGRLVKVELSVKPVSESKVSATTVADVKKTVESLFAFVDMESVKVEYLEIDLTKYVDNVKEGAISDTGKPLEIILTYDTSKAGNPVIIRNHEGAVVVFTQLSARPTGNFTDATYYVEGDKIYMYSQYFSDFAIAYSVEKTFNVILDDGNGNIIRQIVSEGTKFIPPTDLTKDGYEFDGWYKDEAFTEKWNPDTDKVTSDIMLYAKWEEHKEETPTTTEVTTETPATTEETTETPTTTEETTETPTTTEVTTEIPVTTEETTEKPTTTETTTETSVTTEATTETSDVPETKVDTPAKVTNPSNDAKSPKTRDTTHTDIAFFLIIFAALGVLCLGFIRRKI